MARRKGNTNMAKKASLSQKPEKDDDSGSSSDEHEEESQHDHQNIKKSEQPKLQTSSGSEDNSGSSSDENEEDSQENHQSSKKSEEPKLQTSSSSEDDSGSSSDENEDESQENHHSSKKSEKAKLQTSSGKEDDSGNSNDKNEDEAQERQRQNISTIDTINDDLDKENTEAVNSIKTALYKILKDKYLFFDKYGGLKSSQGVTYFNGGCKRSTYNPQVMNYIEYFDNVPELVEFGNIVDRQINLKCRSYKDMKNNNVTIVPLSALVTKNDRHVIYLHSKLKLPDEDQIKDVREYVYECCFIDKIWTLGNQLIRTTVLDFFKGIFASEKNHIDHLLKTESTYVMMILNRTLHKSKDIVVEQIIAGVMYTADGVENICIDFVAAGKGYHGYGYGTLLIHFAQVFATEYNLNHTKKGSTTKEQDSVQKTYLSCRPSLNKYYTCLGFKIISTVTFSQDKNLSEFGKRFNIDHWENDPEDQRLHIFTISGKVPRVINLVPVSETLDIEHSLYDDKLLTDLKKNKVTQNIKEVIKKIIPGYIDRIKLHPETETDLKILESSTDIMDFVKVKYNEHMEISIGQWFRSAFKEELPNFDNLEFKQSQTMLIALENLQIQFFPKDIQDIDIDVTEQWLCVKCSSCGKKVFVKKTKDEKFVKFLLKVVYSVWYEHVFCYATDENNAFNEMNAGWNVCNERRGKFLHRLMESAKFDNSVLLKEEDGRKKLYSWNKFLEFFFVGLKVNYMNLMDAFILYISKVKELQIKDSNTKRKRKCRSLISNYSTERIIGQVPSTTKPKASSRINSKYQKNLKCKRHEQEVTWNETFYHDLEIQESINKIEYIDVKTSESMYQVSFDYLAERDKLKDNNYVDHWGEVQNENHYVGHLKDGTVIVLEEEWFKQYDEANEFSHHVITTSTFKRIRKRKNRPVLLNKKDKRRIQKHVQDVKGMCEIHKIKKIKRDKKDTQQFEYIEFLENQSEGSDNENTKKVRHISVSRYDYEGFDAQGRKYRLSHDWIELNFKANHPKLYRNICRLELNKSIIIPVGWSDANEIKNRINEKDHGPKNKYIQDSDPSCLFTSLANAMVFLGHNELGQKLVEVYYEQFHKKEEYHVTINDVLEVTKDGKYHNPFEPKFRFNITRIKKPNPIDLIPPAPIEIDVIYHCILSNHHAIAICNGLIFDPVLSNSVILNEQNLRICAQVSSFELTSHIIIRAYKYTEE